jgi:hypothetical protein
MSPNSFYWFWWPITIFGIATFSAMHLYYEAGANLRSRITRVALAIAAIGGIAAVSIPLAIAGSTPCSGEGADLISPNMILVGLLVIVWGVLLCALYAAAGVEGLRGLIAPGVTVVAMLVGLFVETFVAYLSLDNYCRTGSRTGLYGQFGVAVFVALTIGTVMILVMRGLRPSSGRDAR